MFTTVSFSATKNSITARCLSRESFTDAILTVHYSSAIYYNNLKLRTRTRETSTFKHVKMHFSIFIIGWENNGALFNFVEAKFQCWISWRYEWDPHREKWLWQKHGYSAQLSRALRVLLTEAGMRNCDRCTGVYALHIPELDDV
jgi:hypothetical protein